MIFHFLLLKLIRNPSSKYCFLLYFKKVKLIILILIVKYCIFFSPQIARFLMVFRISNHCVIIFWVL